MRGDSYKEKEIRFSYLSGLKRELVGQLQKMLNEQKTYIKDFKATIKSVPKNKKKFRVLINADRKPSSKNRVRYNAPTSNEVALMIVGQTLKRGISCSTAERVC
jgi:predicted Ser/Thr protein kinase